MEKEATLFVARVILLESVYIHLSSAVLVFVAFFL